MSGLSEHRSPNVVMRVAEDADLDALRRLLKAVITHMPYTPAQQQRLFSLSFNALRMLTPLGTVYVAQVAEQVIGSAGWNIGPLNHDLLKMISFTVPENSALVYSMYVHPTYAARGIGKQILKTCELAARRVGAHRVILATTPAGEGLPLSNHYREMARTELLVDGDSGLPLTWFKKSLDITT